MTYRAYSMAVLLSVAFAAAAVQAKAPKRVGWVEEIAIADVGTVVKAKLDTGAKTSSIDAEIIDIRKTGEKTSKKTGETVVFSVSLEKGGSKTFEREIRRYVRIKKKGGGFIRRPVIEMRFCIAGRMVEEEVNLANREGFVYPVLVGRNMMAHAELMVDSGAKQLSKPTCTE